MLCASKLHAHLSHTAAVFIPPRAPHHSTMPASRRARPSLPRACALAVLGASAASHAAPLGLGGVGPCVFSFDGPGLRYDLTPLMGQVYNAVDANSFYYAFSLCDRLPPSAAACTASVAQLVSESSSVCVASMGDSAKAVAAPAVDAAGGLQLTCVRQQLKPRAAKPKRARIVSQPRRRRLPSLCRVPAGCWAATHAGPWAQTLRRCASSS